MQTNELPINVGDVAKRWSFIADNTVVSRLAIGWYLAGEALSGHCAVTIGTDGKSYQASPLYYQPIAGITTMAAVMGDNIEVQNSGVLSMIGWNFVPYKPVFVLANGQLSTTPDPTALYSTVVGISNSSNSLVVGIRPQIKLI